MRHAIESVLRGLRAAAEPTRLRMLAVLARGEFSVTELTTILGQSQPRVSRHLKLLGESGLLDRFREQHWIYYRVPVDGPGAALAHALLALVDPEDPLVALDRQRARTVLAERTTGPGEVADDPAARGDAAWALGEVVAAELGGHAVDSVLYVGHDPSALLGGIGPRARRVVGLSDSRDQVQRARACLHGQGLSHCILQQGDLQAVPQPAASFDLVILDCALAAHARPGGVLQEAVRALGHAGRLIVIEDYDALAERGPGDNPLAALRALIAGSGLACVRLRPADLGDRHLLVAVAAFEPSVGAAA